jgi:hypothetical protein
MHACCEPQRTLTSTTHEQYCGRRTKGSHDAYQVSPWTHITIFDNRSTTNKYLPCTPHIWYACLLGFDTRLLCDTVLHRTKETYEAKSSRYSTRYRETTSIAHHDTHPTNTTTTTTITQTTPTFTAQHTILYKAKNTIIKCASPFLFRHLDIRAQ